MLCSIIPTFSLVGIHMQFFYSTYTFMFVMLFQTFLTQHNDPATTSYGLLTVDRNHVFMVPDKTWGARLLTRMVSVGLSCLATWMGDEGVERPNSTRQSLVIIFSSNIPFWGTASKEDIKAMGCKFVVSNRNHVQRVLRKYICRLCGDVPSHKAGYSGK